MTTMTTMTTKRIVLTVLGIVLTIACTAGGYAIIYKSPQADMYTQARTAAEQGGDYLVRHFHPEGGYFDYVYDPVANTVSPTYNLLRHAGTTFAMLTLYESVKKPEYLSMATQALRFAMAQEAPCPSPNSTLTCLYEQNSVKLGGNALAVLALTEYTRVTGDTTYLYKAQHYAEWIVATQSNQGEFMQHEQIEDGTTTDLVSEYYPGEAIFALMRLYALDHDEKWHTAAAKAAQWLIEVRDQGKATADLPHDHWLLYGLNELYTADNDLRYLEHARRITDAIAGLQHIAPADARYVGGFYDPPQSTPTATRVEGLVAAHALFVQAGDDEYTAKSQEIIDRAIPFLLRTQVTAARAQSSGLNSEGAQGGFTQSLDAYPIRIDYVQHNISALLGFVALAK